MANTNTAENFSFPGTLTGELTDLDYALDNLPLMDNQTCLKKANLWKKMHAKLANFYGLDLGR